MIGLGVLYVLAAAQELPGGGRVALSDNMTVVAHRPTVVGGIGGNGIYIHGKSSKSVPELLLANRSINVALNFMTSLSPQMADTLSMSNRSGTVQQPLTERHVISSDGSLVAGVTRFGVLWANNQVLGGAFVMGLSNDGGAIVAYDGHAVRRYTRGGQLNHSYSLPEGALVLALAVTNRNVAAILAVGRAAFVAVVDREADAITTEGGHAALLKNWNGRYLNVHVELAEIGERTTVAHSDGRWVHATVLDGKAPMTSVAFRPVAGPVHMSLNGNRLAVCGGTEATVYSSYDNRWVAEHSYSHSEQCTSVAVANRGVAVATENTVFLHQNGNKPQKVTGEGWGILIFLTAILSTTAWYLFLVHENVDVNSPFAIDSAALL